MDSDPEWPVKTVEECWQKEEQEEEKNLLCLTKKALSKKFSLS
jgi:hypothetical protein